MTRLGMFLLACGLASTAAWMNEVHGQPAALQVRVQLPSPSPDAARRPAARHARQGRQPASRASRSATARPASRSSASTWRTGPARPRWSSMRTRSGSRWSASPTCPPAPTPRRRCSTSTRPSRRADGFTVKMPMDRGEGQQWAQAPGNLYSTPVEVRVDPTRGAVTLTLDKVIPPIPPPADTKYIKHERIQSALLTKFWGRPMPIGANVLLPEGWDTHPAGALPALHLPRPLSVHRFRLPAGAAGSRPEAGFLGALQPLRATTASRSSTRTSSTRSGPGPASRVAS